MVFVCALSIPRFRNTQMDRAYYETEELIKSEMKKMTIFVYHQIHLKFILKVLVGLDFI